MPPAPVTAAVGGAIPALTPPPSRPAPAGEIRPGSLPASKTPVAPPKPGSARARLMESLDSKAAKDPAAPAPVPAAAPPAERPGAAAAEVPAASSPEGTPTPSETAPEPGSAAPEPGSTPAPEAAAPEASKGKKVSPWKLVDDYKGKLATAEKVISDLQSSIVPEVERTKLTERVTKAEARAAELEEHIRYVDYTKSTEFQTKFHAPYEQAFKRQMANLQGLGVPLDDGSKRPFGPQDLLDLINTDPIKANEVADELFGKHANLVMTARNECQRLWDERAVGLEDAKKSGSERVASAQKTYREAQENLAKTVKQTWNEVNAALVADPQVGEFFKPREGDVEWNDRLAKGFALVDKAFNQDPRDPKLTPEERAAVVRNHAAVRNRAASWGPLRHALTKAQSELAAARKQLEGYKGSTPPAGGSTPQSASIPTGPGAKKDRLLASLDKLAQH